MSRRPKPKYDDKFRASAIVMLQAAGYPENQYKLEEVARNLKVPGRTLRRWFNGTSNPPPDNIVRQGKRELTTIFEDVARRYLEHILRIDIMDETSSRDAIIVAATAIDKLQLLEGKATERVELLTPEERVTRIAELLNIAKARERSVIQQ